MKKDFDTIKLIKEKAHIYENYITAVKEIKMRFCIAPIGHRIDNWKFNSECHYKVYGLCFNANTEKPYTCLISVKTIFSNN